MVYKVSIVVPGSPQAGAIISFASQPKVGDRLQVGEVEVEVLEIMDLIPPQGDFHYMHATCKLIDRPKGSAGGR